MLCFLLLSHCALFLCLYLVFGHFEQLSSFLLSFSVLRFSLVFILFQVTG